MDNNRMDLSVFDQIEREMASLHIERPLKGHCVSVADFGARADNGFCNTESFSRALQYCREQNVGTLLIPKGIYHFHGCSEKAHLILDDMYNFTLDGQGSELIFESLKPYLSICRSNRILVKDLILDWNWKKAPLASVGVVSEVSGDGTYFECVFPACKEVEETMEFSIVGPFDPFRYTPGCPGGIEFRPYENRHVKKSGDDEADARMQNLVRELSSLLLPRQQKTGSNRLRFYTADPEFTKNHFHVGSCYNFRHYEYSILTVPIQDTRDCTLEHVTIYSSPGNGFVGNGDIHGLHLKGCRVTVRPGTAPQHFYGDRLYARLQFPGKLPDRRL